MHRAGQRAGKRDTFTRLPDVRPAVRALPFAARLLASRGGRTTELERSERAVRVLEYAGGPEAARVLETLAHGGRNGTAGLAAAALKRLATAQR
jgi:hypothetical protein